MEKNIIDFLNKHNDSQCKKRFWYGFNIHSSLDRFYIEYQKFFSYKNYAFYHDSCLLTSINSYCFSYLKKDIRQMFKLYKYANKNNLKDECIDISEFLLTYLRGLVSKYYSINYLSYRTEVDIFMKSASEIGLKKKDFYSNSNLLDDIDAFYLEVIKYAILNNKRFSPELVNRMCNNLCLGVLYDSYGKNLINSIRNNSIALNTLIFFDKEACEHKDIYLSNILKGLDNNYGYSCVNDLIVEMSRQKLLSIKDLSNIVNKYVVATNNLCDDILKKNIGFITLLANIDELKIKINFLLEKILNFDNIHKSKLHECLVNILCSKRYIIGDEQYSMKGMQNFEYKGEVSKEDRQKIIKDLESNKFYLYKYSTVDFKNATYASIDLYSSHTILSMINSFHINNEYLVYRKDENSCNHIFKEYYDKIGNDYVLNNENLVNTPQSNYYEQLIKYVSTSFIFTQQLLNSIASDAIREAISKLEQEIPCDICNDYVTIVRNVLAIEANLIKIIKKKNLNIPLDGNGRNYLFAIASCFKEDEMKMNGLMYLYYTLNEEAGLNLRNNIMHGTLIGKDDMSIELLVTFSGLLFVSWLLN